MQFMLRALTLLTIVFTSIGHAQNPGDNIFRGIRVYDIDIRFPQTSYWDSLTTYYDAGNEQYMSATVVIDGATYDSVGVRLKGNASYTHPNNKKSFRFSFDEYRSALRWDGLKSVHLNNCWEDPTFMREKIHLDFCQTAGVAAPRANFARLSINDTLFAFYSLVEHVDKRLLKSRLGDDEGDLFKAVDGFGAGSNQILSDFRRLGNVESEYYDRYELKTDGSLTAWPRLMNFIDTLNSSAAPATALPAQMNLQSFYKAMATDNIFGNLDSYAGSSRNFYAYFIPLAAKMEWIVWDVGLSFGAYAGGGVANIERLSVTYVNNATQRPLLGKVLNTPELKNEYLRTLCAVFNEHFSSEKLFPKIDSVANLIRPYVYEDPRKMYSNQQFETNMVSDLTVSAGNRKPGLKSFITQRQANVQTQLTTLGVSCAQIVNPGDVALNEFMAQNDSIFDPAGEAEDWIELYNNTANTINLGGMYLTDAAALPTKWQFPANTTIAPNGFLIVWADEDSGQAGVHAQFKLSASGEHLRLSNTDATALDSVTFGAQTRNLSLARIPNGTGAFVQGKHTFNANNGAQVQLAPGDIVINEFMAQNDSIFDPAGEAEDWIELYNNTAQSVNLGGMHLSDNFTLPAKWQFPANTTIAAHGYLIVWADEDLTQEGLHAAFKLSASGEQIMLSQNDLSVLDSLRFGAQTANRSLARTPNGAGAFVQGRHTFNANNNGGTLAVGAVVINEFAADNDSIADPAGETDDWIELFNNTSETVNLGGYYLSDNKNLPAKWQFPANTLIAPAGFLIVWADEATTQPGLHASWKLSANGEHIRLSNPDSSVVDSVTFGAQVTNRTMSRIPNGVGPFVQAQVTFNALNESATSVRASHAAAAPKQFALAQNYPNPFNPSTTISYQLPAKSRVILKVYTLLGNEVATLVNGIEESGYKTVVFTAGDLPSGIYFYRLEAGDFVQTKRLVLLR